MTYRRQVVRLNYQAVNREMVRHSFNQLTHHRAQLGTYFRLPGLSVPSTYGGSADDDRF